MIPAGLVARIVPWRWWIVAGAIAALVALAAAQTVRLAAAHALVATERAGRAEDRRAAADAARLAGEGYRAEEQRRTAALMERIRDAEKARSIAAADAAAAGAAVVSLRDQARAAAARSRSATCDSSPAGDSTAERLAELLGESVDRYQAVAAAADRAVIAGQLCERAYDALTRP